MKNLVNFLDFEDEESLSECCGKCKGGFEKFASKKNKKDTKKPVKKVNNNDDEEE